LKQQTPGRKGWESASQEAAKIAKRNETADLKFRANLQMKGIAEIRH
jgi:hypothetical protein